MTQTICTACGGKRPVPDSGDSYVIRHSDRFLTENVKLVQ